MTTRWSWLFLRRKSRAFSLVESLILILVVSLTIGGLLTVSAYTTKMQLAGRQHIDSYLAASSWFSALESAPVFDTQAGFNAAVAAANAEVPAAVAYISNPVFVVSGNVAIVSVNVSRAGTNRVISKNYNIYGNETVSDDKVVVP